MEDSDLFHPSICFNQGKELPVTTEWKTGWAKGPVLMLWRREKVLVYSLEHVVQLRVFEKLF
jgi:hypothetical protein